MTWQYVYPRIAVHVKQTDNYDNIDDTMIRWFNDAMSWYNDMVQWYVGMIKCIMI